MEDVLPAAAAAHQHAFTAGPRGEDEFHQALIRLGSGIDAARGAAAQRLLRQAAALNSDNAKAVLGQNMMNLSPGFDRDPVAAKTLLEEAANQQQLDAMLWLARHLHEMSTDSQGDRILERTDPQSQARLARMLALLESGVQYGSAGCLGELAQRHDDGIGTPRDDVAATALAQLARERKHHQLPADDDEFNAMFTPTPAEAAEVRAPVGAWRDDPAELLDGLRRRRQALLAPRQTLQAQLAEAQARAAAAREELARLRRGDGGAQPLARTARGTPTAGSEHPAPGRPGEAALWLGIGLSLLAFGGAGRGAARAVRSADRDSRAVLRLGRLPAWWAKGQAVLPRALAALLCAVPLLGMGVSAVLLWQSLSGSRR